MDEMIGSSAADNLVYEAMTADSAAPAEDRPIPGLAVALGQVRRPLWIVRRDGVGVLASDEAEAGRHPLAAFCPPCPPERLGDTDFCRDYGLIYPYVGGSMANGVSSVEMVLALADAGMLGFFGAGGLSLAAVEAAIDRLSTEAAGKPYGFNLIHSPSEPDFEAATVDLYLRRGVRLVEASAYVDLTLPLVRYRVAGIRRDETGRVETPNRIMAKASRVEVASKFFSPPPEPLLRELVNRGEITADQAALAATVPMAFDLTAEADSGGHTDNRPAVSLIPTMLALRDRMQAGFGYERPLRVGAAGGIATPGATLAAFSMGAAYVMTGSINQSAVESGACQAVRDMLGRMGQADVTMAPSSDMFEMGARVQVLKWGTMFPMRATRLFELYRSCNCLEDIPEAERRSLEQNVFRAPFDNIWEDTKAYFRDRDVKQIAKAEKDPKHRMALIFRWYLGQSSHWAITGREDRKIDYQIYCGPAMGAFNEWVKGSFLEKAGQRRVATLALNLLYGAAVLNRVNILKVQGIRFRPGDADIRPLDSETIMERLNAG